MTEEVGMQDGWNTLKLSCIDAGTLVDFIYVDAAASQHTCEGYNRKSFASHFLLDELSNVDSFHLPVCCSMFDIEEERRALLWPFLYQVSPNTFVETNQKEYTPRRVCRCTTARSRMCTYYIRSGGILPLCPSTLWNWRFRYRGQKRSYVFLWCAKLH